FPHLASHGDQAELALVEVEELALLLDEGQIAVKGVTPRVVLAGELTASTRDFFSGKVVPQQLVSAVAAHVVEAPYGLVLVLDDDDPPALAHPRHLPGEVTPLLRQPLDSPDVEPGLLEDGLLLELVVLGVDRVLVVHGGGAEFRPVLCPAASSRFLEKCH